MATTNEIYSLYLAYFGRPPDAVGFAAAQSKSVAQLQSEFSASAESAALLGSTNLATQVNNIYVNAFGRSAETAGLLYWVGEIAANRVTLSQAAFTIVSSALNDDRTTVTNKITAATAFYAQVVASPANIIGYSGNAASAQARTFLSSVTSSAASVTAAVAGVAAAVTSTVAAGSAATVTPGSTFTLTTGSDAGAAFTGGSGADTFTATLSNTTMTLNSLDSLDGGAGNDTLFVAANGATQGGSIRNIETITVSASANSDLNLLTASGYTTLDANGGSADTVFSNITSVGTGLRVSNTSQSADFRFTAAAVAGTADTATVTLSNVIQGGGENVTINAATGNVETVVLNSTGAANTVTALVTTNATRLNVTGDQALTITGALEATIATVDANAATGAVTATMGAVAAATVTGGSANDVLDVASVTGNVNVSGGAGNDSITIGATLTNTDTISGGDGTGDTLVTDVTRATGYTAPTTATISGIEVLRLTDTLNASLTTTTLASSINTVRLNSGANAGTIVFPAGTATVQLGASLAGQLTVNDTGSATTDSLTITNVATVADDLGDNQALVIGGFETVSIVTSNTGATESQDLSTITITADTGGTSTLNVSGTNRFTASGAITANVINASGLTAQSSGTTFSMGVAGVDVASITGSAGNDTLRGDTSSSIDGGAGRDSIFGGSGNDTLIGGDGNDTITSDAGTDSVSGGAGNDVLVLAGNITAADTIDGGDGTNDILELTNGSITTLAGLSLSEVLALNGNINNVEAFRVTDAFDRGADFDISRLDATSNLILAAGHAGAESISGFANAATVTIGDGDTTGTTALTLALSSSSGSADSFNLNTQSQTGVDVNFDQVTINGVETVNINSTELTASDTVRYHDLDLNANALQTLTLAGTERLDMQGVATVARTVTSTNTAGVYVSVANTGGNATVTGSTGTDVFIGGAGADSISGGSGADSISGGGDNDTLVGGEGADNLSGGAGNDSIDLTEAAAASDRVNVTHVSATNGTDVITAFGRGSSNGDVINIEAATSLFSADTALSAFTDTQVRLQTATTLGGTAITAATTDSLIILDSQTYGSAALAEQAITASHGASNFAGNRAFALYSNGTDAFLVYDSASGTNGTTLVTIARFAGVDTTAKLLEFSLSNFSFGVQIGSDFHDTLTGVASFGDSIDGGAGNDAITGDSGADTLLGGAGADTITGGAGADNVTAGEGADIVVIGDGQDVVSLTETTAAADSVQFSTAFAAGNANAATITGFANAAGIDTFDIGFALGNGTGTFAAGLGATNTIAAVAPVSVANNGQASANDVLFVFGGAGDQMAAGSTLANAVANAVTALTSGADFSGASIDATDSIVLVLDDGTNSFVFHYVAGGTAAQTEAGDLELIGIINGVADASTFATGDFI